MAGNRNLTATGNHLPGGRCYCCVAQSLLVSLQRALQFPAMTFRCIKLIKSGFSTKLIFLSLSFIQKIRSVGFEIIGWEEKLEFRENRSKSFFTKNLFVKSVRYAHCPLTPGIVRQIRVQSDTRAVPHLRTKQNMKFLLFFPF